MGDADGSQVCPTSVHLERLAAQTSVPVAHQQGLMMTRGQLGGECVRASARPVDAVENGVSHLARPRRTSAGRGLLVQP